MNKVNVEKVIDYTKVLKDNEVLQDMDKILRNENTNLKLEIERLKEENELLKSNPNFVYAMRNNKAIEYIKSFSDEDISVRNHFTGIIREELLNILKGGDKE